MGLLESSKSSLRAAVIISMVTLYFCAVLDRENKYEKAWKDLDLLIDPAAEIYQGKALRAFKENCAKAPADSLFLEVGLSYGFKLGEKFPQHFPLTSRCGNSISAPYYGNWISNNETVFNFLYSVRNFRNKASFIVPELTSLPASLDTLFSSLQQETPTLIAYSLKFDRKGYGRFAIDMDLDWKGRGFQKKKVNGFEIVKLSEKKHQGIFRYKYSIEIPAQERAYFPSFSSFMVDSVGVGELSPSGGWDIPSLQGLVNEIGDMGGREAIRHLQNEAAKNNQSGSVFSISFSYHKSSWLPLFVILVLLGYSLVHLRELNKTNTMNHNLGSSWIVACNGRMPIVVSWIFLASPVLAGLVSIVCWPNNRIENVVISILLLSVSILMYREFRSLRSTIEAE